MKPKGSRTKSKTTENKFAKEINKMSFEEALERLDTIVQKMEDSDLPLEETMDAYEEGVFLTKHCRDKLKEAEARIEVLEKGSAENKENTDRRKDQVAAKKVKTDEQDGEFMIDERLQGTLLDIDD